MKTRKGLSERAIASPAVALTRARGRPKKSSSAGITPKRLLSPSSNQHRRGVTPATPGNTSRARARSAGEQAALEATQLTATKQMKRSERNKAPSNGVCVAASPVASAQIDFTTKGSLSSSSHNIGNNRKSKRNGVLAATKTSCKLRSILKTPSILVKESSDISKRFGSVKSPIVGKSVGNKTTESENQVMCKQSRKSNHLSSLKSPASGKNTSKTTSISSSTPRASGNGNLSSFSDFSDTASPIIRTRKPNLKYAEFDLPSNSFFKKVLLKNAELGTPVISGRNSPSNSSSSQVSIGTKASPVATISHKSIGKSPKLSSKNGSLEKSGKGPVSSVKKLSISSSKNVAPKTTGECELSPQTQKSNRAVSNKIQPEKRKQRKTKIASVKDSSGSRIQGVRTRVNRKPNPKYSPPASPVRKSPKESSKVSKSSKIKSTSSKSKASTSRRKAAKSTKAVSDEDSNRKKKNDSRSKTTASFFVGKASSPTSKHLKPGQSLLSTPVKLSQCSIQLAVFISPPPGTSENTSRLAPLGNLSGALQKPRLSKREELALALRKSKLSDTVNASCVVNSTTSSLTPQPVGATVIDKQPVSKTKRKGKAVNVSRTVSNTTNSSSLRSTTDNKKQPVWAKVSPIKNQMLTEHHVEEMYNLSFSSEENAPAKAKPKKRTKRKNAKEKPRPVYTKSKLLTTDPNFNKAFPAMFGVQSFYAGSNNSQTVGTVSSSGNITDSVESRNKSPSPAVVVVDNDVDTNVGEVEMFDEHYDDLPEDSSTENFVPPSYETASSFVSSSTNFNVPDIVISTVARMSIPVALVSTTTAAAVHTNQGLHTESSNQEASNDNNPMFNKESNNNSNNNSSNKSIPTPAATRIMSKLVGGTSTPFNEQVRNPALAIDHQIPALEDCSQRISSPPPPPATVSEQIQVCFGFDESEGDEDDNPDEMSLNLSPVRRTTNLEGLSHHVSTMSIFSDIGGVEKEVAPTRFVPLKAMRAPSYNSFSSSRTANNNTLGLSKSAGVQQTNRAGNASSSAPGSGRGVPLTPQNDAETIPVPSPTNASSSSQATACDVFVTRRKVPSSKRSTSKSPRAANDASSEAVNAGDALPAAVNFDESRLFDEAPVESPAKKGISSLPSREANEQQPTPLPVATPEKSFSKPPSKSYDRRSLDESRRTLLESLAGGAPNSGDEDADQEDLSQVVTRRKKKHLANSSERRLQQQKSRVAAASSKQRTAKRPFGAATACSIADIDTSQEENKGSHHPAKRVKPILKQAKAGSKKAPAAAVARTKQTKLKMVKIHPPQPERGGEATLRKDGDSSVDSSASSSKILSLSSKSKKPSKSVAFEQTVNDWASDINSHFSEIEDCELLLA